MIHYRFLLYLLSMATVMAQNTNNNDVNISINKNGSLQASGILAGIILIAVGFVFTFFGRKILKVIIFLSGFAIFTIIALAIMYKIRPAEEGEKTRALIYLICSLVVGLLGGIISIFLYKVGLFFLGALGGAALGAWILTWSSTGIFKQQWVQIIFVCAFALIGGIIILFIEKPVTIVYTSVCGSYSMFVGIDCFARTGFKEAATSIFSQVSRIQDQNTKIYGMLAGAALTAILGMVVQFYSHRTHSKRQLIESHDYGYQNQGYHK